MHLQPLYKRTTHKYRDGWRHLDRSMYVGTVKVLQGRVVREAEDFDDGGEVLHRVVAPRDLRDVDLSRAIIDTMGGNNCQHEHDCCGCELRHVTVTRIKPRQYAVVISYSYNY